MSFVQVTWLVFGSFFTYNTFNNISIIIFGEKFTPQSHLVKANEYSSSYKKAMGGGENFKNLIISHAFAYSHGLKFRTRFKDPSGNVEGPRMSPPENLFQPPPTQSFRLSQPQLLLAHS